MTLYCCNGSSTTSNNSFKTTPLVCKIFEKDFLSDILDFLELPAAKYSADVGVTENDLFTSTCSIF